VHGAQASRSRACDELTVGDQAEAEVAGQADRVGFVHMYEGSMWKTTCVTSGGVLALVWIEELVVLYENIRGIIDVEVQPSRKYCFRS
jgi:hypothetical protein